MSNTLRYASFLIIMVLSAIAARDAAARQAGPDRETVHVPFSSDRWRIEGEGEAVRFEQYRGRAAVRLQGGAVALDDIDFRNGTIEFDMAFPHGRGFHGLRFRTSNEREFEHFYFRSHLSGMPDANQYQPIIGGYAAWQLLHGEPYSSPTVYRESDWIHVRLVVSDDTAEVYIDSVEPELTFKLLSRSESGGLALTASALNPVWYTNLTYSLVEESIRGTATGLDALPQGSVTSWNVSRPIAEDATSGPRLDSDALSSVEWRRLVAGENGVVNLARVIDDTVAADGWDRSVTNTVVARLDIEASRARSLPVEFGYSDRVRVFLNGQLLYMGNNGYLTRDYRYLGTIGLFDTVWLDLQDGANRLEFVVSEDFGGWGLIARFPDRDGLYLDGTVIR